MTAGESIEIVVARLDERTQATASDVSEIKLNMATRGDQEHVDRRISELTGALASEATARAAAVEAEAVSRARGIAEEKQERVAADEKEANERRAVATRLQVVEDRMEARKYNVGIAIVLSAVGAVFSIVATVLNGTIGG